jgi:membrane dipeptidase
VPNTPALVDGCSWTFDGYTGKLAASHVTALNLTVAGAREGFLGALDRIQDVLVRIARQPERLRLARRADDLDAAGADRAVAIVLNFQNGAPLERDLGRLDLFRELGVRNVQLTYNERNAIGDGCLEPSDAGLARFGRQVVRHMNDLGMVVDLSHAGRRTSLEALELSVRPCVFSHANPRALIDNPRNIDDDQIRACADGGGVIGACAWGPILWRGGDDPPGLEDLLDVIEFLAEAVGADHVSVGTDSTSSERDDHIAAHAHEVNETYPEVTAPFVARFGGTPRHRYPVPIERLPEVARGLAGRGWSSEDIGKVAGGNLLRVWRSVWLA